MQERRSQFLINKPLQLRYMAYVTIALLVVASIAIFSFYFGIWGGVLDAFSDAKFREDLLTATRLSQYESARLSPKTNMPMSLAFFDQAEKLTSRQREVFKTVLVDTNKKLIPRFVLLVLLIGWGSIYLSHKVAGPLYRFQLSLGEIQKGNMAIRIRLRQYDEAQFLGHQFNETLEYLDSTFAKLKNIVRENSSNPERLKSRLNEELSQIKTSATTA